MFEKYSVSNFKSILETIVMRLLRARLLQWSAGPRPVKIPQNGFGPVKNDFNWSYRASKHLGTFLQTSFPSKMSPMFFFNK